MKATLNIPIIIDGITYAKGETIELSSNMFNTLKSEGIEVNEIPETKKSKKEKPEKDNEQD